MAPETHQLKSPKAIFSLLPVCLGNYLHMAAFQKHEVTRSESSSADASLAHQSFAIYIYLSKFSQIQKFSVTDLKIIYLLCLKKHKYWELRV